MPWPRPASRRCWRPGRIGSIGCSCALARCSARGGVAPRRRLRPRAARVHPSGPSGRRRRAACRPGGGGDSPAAARGAASVADARVPDHPPGRRVRSAGQAAPRARRRGRGARGLRRPARRARPDRARHRPTPANRSLRAAAERARQPDHPRDRRATAAGRRDHRSSARSSARPAAWPRPPPVCPARRRSPPP
jgi:hypothetical protein